MHNSIKDKISELTKQIDDLEQLTETFPDLYLENNHYYLSKESNNKITNFSFFTYDTSEFKFNLYLLFNKIEIFAKIDNVRDIVFSKREYGIVKFIEYDSLLREEGFPEDLIREIDKAVARIILIQFSNGTNRYGKKLDFNSLNSRVKTCLNFG